MHQKMDVHSEKDSTHCSFHLEIILKKMTKLTGAASKKKLKLTLTFHSLFINGLQPNCSHLIRRLKKLKSNCMALLSYLY